MAADVAKSAGSGLVRGVTGIAGSVGDFAALLGRGADAAAPYVVSGINKAFGTKFDDSPINLPNPTAAAIGSQSINSAVDSATGMPVTSYKPQTIPGQYARTVGEFAPGLAMPGGPVARVVGNVLAPAIASETMGQVAHRAIPELEGPARLVGAIGATGIASLASRPNTAEAAITAGMRGVDDMTLTGASQLMQAAQQRGVNLTWPEAIAQASGGGGRGLTNMQRVVEGSQGGGDVMGGFMARRPGQIEAAARNEFGAIAPQSQAPSSIGPAVGRAADDTVKEATGIINNATRPAYQAAEAQRIGPQVHAALSSDPLYAEVLKEVRNNPALNRTIANLPDDSVGVIDMVQRRMRERATNAAVPGQASSGNTIAAAYQDARTAPIAAAETVTGSRAATPTQPAQVGSYEAARAQQEALRQKYLEPLMAGPIGKLANRDITTQQAITALFPSNPLPGSAAEIVDAVGALAKKNSLAARQLVRTHIESTFNEASQAIQGGANQFGGAGFAAALRGNTQQAENLAAAIQGVAGPQALKGFDQFLDIMSATGQRQRIGSQTAFNQEAQDLLRRGGMIGEAANTLATGGIKLPGKVKEAYEQWRLGKNTEQIAKLFTDPNAIGLFRQLSKAAPGSSQAQAISARLALLAVQGRMTAQQRP